MTITIQTMSDYLFCLSDGSRVLHLCPCCGLPFQTRSAVQSVLDAIESGRLTFDQAFVLAEEWSQKP